MGRITSIIDPCTLKIHEAWTYMKLKGNLVRIGGLHLPEDQETFPKVMMEMEKQLVGHDLKIVAPYYIQSGRILVAKINVYTVNLEEIFGSRYSPQPPRTRIMDIEDLRNIRRVNSFIPSQWTNPLRILDYSYKPALGNDDFPTDYWTRDYDKSMDRIMKIYSVERERKNEDEATVERFLHDGNNKILLLLGGCGCGKSWFIRNYLKQHPPKDMDIAFIDVSDFLEGNAFLTRLNLRLSEVLGELVNKREGGLRIALKNQLMREVKGIYPNDDYESEKVKAWCERYLSRLSEDIVAYNTVRLASYAYSSRPLLIVVDNIDGYSEADQDKLFQLVATTVTQHPGLLLIVTLRPTSEFFSARCNTSLQKLHKTYHLSKIQMIPMIRRRLSISEVGNPLSSLRVDDPTEAKGYFTIEDILNYYVDSPAELIILDLAQGDVRQYIRLFRRLIYSDEIRRIKNVGSEYYCITALMMQPNERFTEDTSFIANVFDNDHPEEIGNCLIRRRVLEYFLKGYKQCDGDLFEYYFNRLGYDLRRVKEVIRMWSMAGVINLYRRDYGVEAEITESAQRYESLIGNLWYCIAVKTGMNIDVNYILTGHSAKREARKVAFALPPGSDWVADEGFLTFLADEEGLEELRIEHFPGKEPALEEKIRSKGPTSIQQRLWFAYTHQALVWEKKRQREGV